MKDLAINIIGGIIVLILAAVAGVVWDQIPRPLFGTSPTLIIAYTGLVALAAIVLGFLAGSAWRLWRAKRLLEMPVEEATAQLKEYRSLKEKYPGNPIEGLLEENRRLACENGRLEGHIEVLRDGGYVSKREIELRSEEYSDEVLKEIAEGKY